MSKVSAAILLARARARRPDALSAEQVLRMATIDGARAIGLGDSIGSLAPHKRADLTVLDLSATPFLPWEDPITAAVYGGTPDRVLLTIVDGQIRFNRDGGAADTEPARRVRAKMLDR
jgi:5-methylthioadenosine/S-adenosylhomocysteine deaminase